MRIDIDIDFIGSAGPTSMSSEEWKCGVVMMYHTVQCIHQMHLQKSRDDWVLSMQVYVE